MKKIIIFSSLIIFNFLLVSQVFANEMTPGIIETLSGKYALKHIDSQTKEATLSSFPEDPGMPKVMMSLPNRIVGLEDNCELVFNTYDDVKIYFKNKGELVYDLGRNLDYKGASSDDEITTPDGVVARVSRSSGKGYFTRLEFYSGLLKVDMTNSSSKMVKISLPDGKEVIAQGNGIFEVYLDNNLPNINVISGELNWNPTAEIYLSRK